VYVHQVVVQEFEPPTDPAQTQQSVPELTVLMKTQRLSHVVIKRVPVSILLYYPLLVIRENCLSLPIILNILYLNIIMSWFKHIRLIADSKRLG